jgi:hypothetical protein
MLKNKLLSAMGGVEAIYIEDVFSTYLYSGSSPSSQDILNGVDLDGEGGLIWIKDRSRTANHKLVDTARSSGQTLATNLDTFNTGEVTSPTWLSNGFSLPGYVLANETGVTYASWTFRKAEKFFDVVTYTGDGAVDKAISHSLGSEPGAVIIKSTSASGTNWIVQHRDLLADRKYLVLNSTAAAVATVSVPTAISWNDSSTIYVHEGWPTGSGNDLNTNGVTYVAYIFAHNAGGFGLTGTDNVISCGSFTTDGSGFATVNLGYEAQWALVKKSSSTGAWAITDNMRGWVTGAALNTSDDAVLFPNVTNAETTQGRGYPTATGFSYADSADSTYIYIAIRRGPMKVPTTGASVFAPVARAGTSSVANVTSGFPTDLFINLNRDHLYFANNPFFDRLRGLVYSNSNSTAAEFDGSPFLSAYGNTGVTLTSSGLNSSATTYITYSMGRAPGFFDEVCYTGNAVANTARNHNLGVVPELIIFKGRSLASNWPVYCQYLNNSASQNNWRLRLNETGAQNSDSGIFGNTLPTSSLFYTAGNSQDINFSGETYVAYLFASCPGVSKVGSYTGTGSPLTINCGFTGGARFVLIKRADDTGDWYVWDTARGIVSGNDPHLSLNTTAAEVTSNDTIDTDSTGFVVNQVSATNVNVSSATYIFLAIA